MIEHTQNYEMLLNPDVRNATMHQFLSDVRITAKWKCAAWFFKINNIL